MKLKNLIILLISLMMFGCGEVRVDTSSYETLVKSLGKIRASLPDNKKKEFDEYSMMMAFYDVDPKMLGPDEKIEKINNAKINVTLNGKTGEEILAEGPKYKTYFEMINREKLVQEHNALMKIKNDFILSKKMLLSFKVVRSRIFKEKAVGSDVQVPVLELNVKNGTNQAIFKVHFDWELINPSNNESKGERAVVYEFPAGLNPNDSATWKVFPKITDIEISPELKLKINIIRLDDKNGDSIFISNDISKEEEERLKELKTILQIQK